MRLEKKTRWFHAWKKIIFQSTFIGHGNYIFHISFDLIDCTHMGNCPTAGENRKIKSKHIYWVSTTFSSGIQISMPVPSTSNSFAVAPFSQFSFHSIFGVLYSVFSNKWMKHRQIQMCLVRQMSSFTAIQIFCVHHSM